MGMICNAAFELRIQRPDGNVIITATGPSITSKGQVILHGSRPLADFRWYRDVLKHAGQALKHGKCQYSKKSECWVIRWNQSIVLQSNEPMANTRFFRALLRDAAGDIVERDREPAKPTAIECPKGGIRIGAYNFRV